MPDKTLQEQLDQQHSTAYTNASGKPKSKEEVIRTAAKAYEVDHILFDQLEVDVNRHIFISGQTQSGKSFFAKRLFESLPKNIPAIFYDFKHDVNHIEFVNQFKIFKSLSQMKLYLKTDKTLMGKKKDLRVVYQPDRPEVEEIAATHSLKNPRWKQMNDLAEFAFRKGNIILFIDECAVFSSPQLIPPSYYDLMVMGSSRNAIVVSISQRPNVIHNTIISESYTRVLFRHDLESDRMKLRGIVGDEVSEMLYKLPNRVFVVAHMDGSFKTGSLEAKKGMK